MSIFLLLWCIGCLLLGACATGPRLEAIDDQATPVGSLGAEGVRLTFAPDAWSGPPSDLANAFTAFGVVIENGRPEEVLVRYEDFVCLDDGNRQYRVVPPGEVARAVSGARIPGDPRPGPGPLPALVAGPWRPYRPAPWWPYAGPYGPWWPDPYYPYPWPRPASLDVLRLGMREGPVLPGASIRGILFFQHATAQGVALTLTWTPRLSDQTPLPPISMRFRIVR